jgi:RNA polymerase sigma-70 factor (ECF subfamily)
MTGEATMAAADQTAGTAADRLAALFDAHHQRPYRLARRLSRNAEDARDLVQNTYLRAARTPGSIPIGASNEEAWLVRVLVNICRDNWRQIASRSRIDHRDMPSVLPPADPESALVSRSVIWHALDRLDPKRRAVLVMYELEGTPIDAIARSLGVTTVTVRWHLSRGRRQMAAVIQGRVGAP